MKTETEAVGFRFLLRLEQLKQLGPVVVSGDRVVLCLLQVGVSLVWTRFEGGDWFERVEVRRHLDEQRSKRPGRERPAD